GRARRDDLRVVADRPESQLLLGLRRRDDRGRADCRAQLLEGWHVLDQAHGDRSRRKRRAPQPDDPGEWRQWPAGEPDTTWRRLEVTPGASATRPAGHEVRSEARN